MDTEYKFLDEDSLVGDNVVCPIYPRVYIRDTGSFLRKLTAACCRAERAANKFFGL